MKRSPLERRTPLKMNPAKPLTTSTPIRQKSAAKKRAEPTERIAKRLVRARSEGLCEIRIPEVCTGRGTDFSHRLAASQGGPWAASNGLRACRSCHSWCHAHPDVAYSWGWQLRPTYRLVNGKRVLRPATEFPAYLWRPGAWQPEWYWLYDDDREPMLVDFFDLPVTAGRPRRQSDAA